MARQAITHDDSGVRRVPTSGADWDGWVSASVTRNHVLGDPLLDWLGRHGGSKGFVPDEADERTDFRVFIFGKGVEFERAVVQHLRGRIEGDVRTIGVGSQSRGAARDLSLAVDTWDAMNDGVAVIDQGVLWDPEHRTYGLPDLLVRSDVLAGLFAGALSSQDAAVEAPDLDIGGCHYVVVDIKYTTLRFTAKGKLSNSSSSPAYKVRLTRFGGHCGVAPLSWTVPNAAVCIGHSLPLFATICPPEPLRRPGCSSRYQVRGAEDLTVKTGVPVELTWSEIRRPDIAGLELKAGTAAVT